MVREARWGELLVKPRTGDDGADRVTQSYWLNFLSTGTTKTGFPAASTAARLQTSWLADVDLPSTRETTHVLTLCALAVHAFALPGVTFTLPQLLDTPKVLIMKSTRIGASVKLMQLQTRPPAPALRGADISTVSAAAAAGSRPKPTARMTATYERFMCRPPSGDLPLHPGHFPVDHPPSPSLDTALAASK